MILNQFTNSKKVSLSMQFSFSSKKAEYYHTLFWFVCMDSDLHHDQLAWLPVMFVSAIHWT